MFHSHIVFSTLVWHFGTDGGMCAESCGYSESITGARCSGGLTEQSMCPVPLRWAYGDNL